MSLIKTLITVFLLIATTPFLMAEEAKVGVAKVGVAKAEEKNTADAELQQQEKLTQAGKLIASGNPAEAIVLIDQTLEHYRVTYPESTTRWYVARTIEETVLYMAEAAIFGESAGGKQNAVALTVAWADAYYMKAYAYVEMQKTTEAKAAIEQALLLSPKNATYLIESAEIAKLERDWDTAYKFYVEAESASKLSPQDEKAPDFSHAKRGQAFVFIEQGKLDEAEVILKECLKLDKNDQRAKEELEFIKSLRKKA